MTHDKLTKEEALDLIYTLDAFLDDEGSIAGDYQSLDNKIP